MSTNLNGFDERLLNELKRVVAGRAATKSTPVARTRFGWKPRLALAAGAAALGVTGAVVTAVAPGQETTTSAYAVTTEQDGKVRVEIKITRDADGLERKLEKVGIAAEVDYLSGGQRCQHPRYTKAPGTIPLRIDRTGKRASVVFIVDPADFRGRTLVIEVSGPMTRNGVTDVNALIVAMIDIAVGEVKPCAPVDVPLPTASPS